MPVAHLTFFGGETLFNFITTANGRGYAIEDTGFDHMLGQFEELAQEFLEFAVEDRHHGFSNVKDTIEEIHKGVSKAFPCGAGLGLMGVLQHLLGAAALRWRLLPRGACALRRHGKGQPALLRLDPELDRHLPEGVRRDRGQEPGVSGAVRGLRGGRARPVSFSGSPR